MSAEAKTCAMQESCFQRCGHRKDCSDSQDRPHAGKLELVSTVKEVGSASSRMHWS